MSAGAGRTRRRGRGHGGGHEEGSHADERWLVTYADMITLLMALFMVLYAMSTVDSQKLKLLSASLNDAFSHILPGSKSIVSGAPSKGEGVPSQAPVPPIQAAVKDNPKQAAARAKDNTNFEKIQQKVDAYAKSHHLSKQIATKIDQRGLTITLLADNILFPSGSATLNGAANPILDDVVGAVNASQSQNAIEVEGHTDDVPVHGQYPSNWELSSARASSVVRQLIIDGMAAGRLSAAGYSYLHPQVPNTTTANRAKNRRVEIVMLRSGSPSP